MRRTLALLLAALFVLPGAARAEVRDTVPRTVVMTAYQIEFAALAGSVEAPVEYRINGSPFLTGTLAGKPVVLMQSGVSMVNAAMNTRTGQARRTGQLDLHVPERHHGDHRR